MRDDKENIIVNRTLQFSLEIISFCEILESSRKFVVARQLLKSGTSIGANVREAQNAESKADFIHKMKIAAKEADETQYWLTLCQLSTNYPDCTLLLSEVQQVMNILNKIIGTSKR
ncbi:MAG: four helix bundle protein [Cytophagia bacterium]|nr:MAG: four helix bundle protein [Runella slithyformis]TAG18125.1 MAG: four helix bundle protein [Cytophagales bacterium]TAG37673.1 MAG: four helix bundle protein [Cytophagia bacterium]TAG50828.1 MAG: four helix bundle protein [Runella slithyformis]TAG78813.1 MAG: four helix bundle protein [Cytophagales bacterium]